MGQPAQDRVRNQQLPRTGPTLDTLDEAFTSTNWIVRIYAVKREVRLDVSAAQADAAGPVRARAQVGLGLRGRQATETVESARDEPKSLVIRCAARTCKHSAAMVQLA